MYAYIGLKKALINYDSTKYNQFTNYAVKYIYSEVFAGIYQLYPMYTCDGNYKYKKKQKVMYRMNNKHKRYETLKHQYKHDKLGKLNKQENAVRKKNGDKN